MSSVEKNPNIRICWWKNDSYVLRNPENERSVLARSVFEEVYALPTSKLPKEKGKGIINKTRKRPMERRCPKKMKRKRMTLGKSHN